MILRLTVATRQLTRLLAVALVSAIAVMTDAPAARACSCGSTAGVEGSDGAFIGVYLGRDPVVGANPTSATYHFKVERVVKGDLGPEIDVLSAPNSAACGFGLTVGQRTGVLLERFGGMWRSGLCSQVEADDLPGGVPPRGEVRDDGNSLAFVLVGVTIALATAGAFFYLRRRRTPRAQE